MLICEMAAYYADRGHSLLDVLHRLCEEHGVYCHKLVNAQFEGAQGMVAMENLMTSLRETPPTEIAGLKVLGTADYLRSERRTADGEVKTINLPKSNVLSYELENHAGLIVRPSGTEPKIKGYVTATGATPEKAAEVAAALVAATETLLAAK